MTNADKIRALPDEKLADVLRKCCIASECSYCPLSHMCERNCWLKKDWLDWLESEAEE